MKTFWDKVWEDTDIEDYEKYICFNKEYHFIKLFKEHGVVNVCDAACGFGKYSVICGKNNFQVSGFDIAKSSVQIAKKMLNRFGIKAREYKVSSITDVYYEDDVFDGVIAHSVIDHLTCTDAIKAVNELLRITRQNGLIYISFDGIEKEDLDLPHTILNDGSFKYTEGKREGMIFRYYRDEEIKKLFCNNEILYFNIKGNGEREIIIRKTIL